MPTKQRNMTTVTSKEHLVVAGGMSGPFINSSISTVEVMDVKILQWPASLTPTVEHQGQSVVQINSTCLEEVVIKEKPSQC